MEKILVISDIHGSKKYLDKALTIFNEGSFEKLIILGDLYYHGPRNPLPEDYDPKSCAIELNKIKDKVIVVKGNCDAEVDQMISEFQIQDNASLNFGKFKIYMDHGHHAGPDNIPSGDYNLYLYGHYHITKIENVDDKIIASPGSISLPKDGVHGYIVISDEGNISLYNLLTNELIKSVDL